MRSPSLWRTTPSASATYATCGRAPNHSDSHRDEELKSQKNAVCGEAALEVVLGYAAKGGRCVSIETCGPAPPPRLQDHRAREPRHEPRERWTVHDR